MAVPGLSSTSWLKGLQQQFESGENGDVVIRVRLTSDDEAMEPPKQRRRTTDGAAEEEEERRYTDIPAHAMIVTTRSRYMASCLKKEWKEGQQRMVELTLEDKQALEDLRLLLRLSYTDSYVKASDTGALLPRPVRLRLAALADALEFTEAVEQVVASLVVNLDFETALTALDDLPLALEAHAGMTAVREAVVATLAEGIPKMDKNLRRLKEEEEEENLLPTTPQEQAAEIATLESKLTHAGDVLATCLGFVAAMFCVEKETRPGRPEYFSDYSRPPLRPVVKELPSSALKALLKSERLQLQTESEAYMLLCSWLDQSPHVTDENWLATYRRLIRHIRFHHFPLHYVGNMLPDCPLLRDSGLSSIVLGAALVLREVSAALVRRNQVSQGPRERGVENKEAVWKLSATIPLASCLALEPQKCCHTFMGIVAGYPLAYQASGHGWPDLFKKPWAEVVYQGSPHFPDGKMEMEVEAKLILKE